MPYSAFRYIIQKCCIRVHHTRTRTHAHTHTHTHTLLYEVVVVVRVLSLSLSLSLWVVKVVVTLQRNTLLSGGGILSLFFFVEVII